MQLVKPEPINWSKLHRIKNATIVIAVWLGVTHCNMGEKNRQSTPKESAQWGEATIDPGISKEAIYSQLDKQTEIFSGLEEQDSSRKRTSDVAYFSGYFPTEKYLNDKELAKFNNCRAYFRHSDTLTIRIGIGTGFGGWGFSINYKDKKFQTEPFYSTDVVEAGQVEPTNKVAYQKLTLDKPSYKPGDSLYGRIEFKSIQTSKGNGTTEHSGAGSFRTKVGDW
jgi:hypothetical protein